MAFKCSQAGSRKCGVMCWPLPFSAIAVPAPPAGQLCVEADGACGRNGWCDAPCRPGWVRAARSAVSTQRHEATKGACRDREACLVGCRPGIEAVIQAWMLNSRPASHLLKFYNENCMRCRVTRNETVSFDMDEGPIIGFNRRPGLGMGAQTRPPATETYILLCRINRLN